MSGPLVSIVVPVYNVECYVEECLQSVCSQTYENLEIICIDDVGSDKSMDIVRLYATKDSRINIVEHEKNKGLAEARNTGLRNLSGDYVFFLDSDDFLSVDAIERLVRCASMCDTDIVIGGASVFSDDESEETRVAVESLKAFLTLPECEEMSEREWLAMANGIPCVAWGKLFKIEFIRQNGLKFISANVRHEDNGFHLKCVACSPKISFLAGDDIYHYRIRRTSIMGKLRSTRDGKSREDLQRVLSDAFGFIKRRNPDFCDFVRDCYWSDFAFRCFGCVFYWGRYWKYLKIGPVVLIKKGVSSDGQRHFLKVLGLKVYEKPFVL